MKLPVYRDETGRVVNIGEWDEMRSVDEATGEVHVRNPVPEGLTVAEEEVVETEHGRFATSATA